MDCSGFEGRLVVVGGGNGALGSEVVRQLLTAGATVVDSSLPGRAEPAEHPQLRRVVADLTKEADVIALYDSLPKAPWASLHVAGGFAMGALAETSPDDLRRMFDLNVVTALLCSREAAKRMSGGGRMVNVVARPVLQPAGSMTAYAVAKAGVAALTQTLAVELADQRILVNAIAPSIIDTAANRAAMPDADHDTWPTPAELARVILFLASPANSVTSGALVPVYGRA